MDLYNKYRFFIFGFLLAAFCVFIIFYLVPAFQGRIVVQPDAFLGPVRIHGYSLTFFCAVLAGLVYATRVRERFGVSAKDVDNLVVISVFAGFAGARIHHVLSAWSYYAASPMLIPQIWRGGAGFYGGLIASVLTALVYCYKRKLVFWQVADLFAPAIALGQSIGRWGNFFNQEAYGWPTDLPWKMFVSPSSRVPEFYSESFFHPAFLYESLWDLAVFALLVSLTRSKRRPYPGIVFACYLVFYSFGRFVIEPLRADSTIAWGYPVNQLLSLLFVVSGTTLIALRRRAHLVS